jgi:hypothetical protein
MNETKQIQRELKEYKVKNMKETKIQRGKK